MNDQLETIKKNLPSGWQQTIADRVGCTTQTVNNIMNRRRDKNKNSKYATKVLTEAAKLAEEHHKEMQCITKIANKLNAE